MNPVLLSSLNHTTPHHTRPDQTARTRLVGVASLKYFYSVHWAHVAYRNGHTACYKANLATEDFVVFENPSNLIKSDLDTKCSHL